MSSMSQTSMGLVLLAAGGGRRLGGGKLLLPWRGKPVLLHVLAQAARLAAERPVVGITLVLGHEADKVRQVVFGEGGFTHPLLRCVVNSRWEEGQSGSLRLGVEALAGAAEAAGAGDFCGGLVLLGDQVLLRPETLLRLTDRHIEAFRQNPLHPATAPVFEGRRGNPVFLSPRLFPLLAGLRGDVGARGILAGLGEGLLRVEVTDPGVVMDLDTPADYAGLPG